MEAIRTSTRQKEKTPFLASLPAAWQHSSWFVFARESHHRQFNTGVGAGTLSLNNGNENTAVGAAALLLNTTGEANTAVGVDALLNNTIGEGNTATGA